MSKKTEAEREQVAKEFYEILNRHGYGFQYSVLQLRDSLEKRHRSGWDFEVTEFPVEVQGRGTRIDFILRNRHSPLYMIAECKRANPALSNWCFARVPYVRKDEAYSYIFLEHIELYNDRLHTFGSRQLPPTSGKGGPFHIALEIRSNRPGDPSGARPEAIEDAATQVCRGLNGMVEFLARNTQVFKDNRAIGLLPVIFTTAQIWVSEVDLGSADLISGRVETTEAEFTSKDWILYQYHISPGLKHSFRPTDPPDSLGGIMEAEYIRTIPIVSSSGVAAFLDWSCRLVVDQARGA